MNYKKWKLLNKDDNFTKNGLLQTYNSSALSSVYEITLKFPYKTSFDDCICYKKL